MSSESGSVAPLGSSRRVVAAWCLYDWANSAYPTLIVTFVFAVYFTDAVAADPVTGTSQWGWMMSASGIALAILAPIFGAISDHGGRRKPWIATFTALAVVAAVGLWWIEADPRFVIPALLLVAIGNTAFEFGQVFYNAMLPDLVSRQWLGRISGWAWGLGYAGGLTALGVCLVLFIQPDPSPFGLDRDNFEHVRIIGPAIALWFVLFCLPMFLITPDRPGSGVSLGAAVRGGLASLRDTFLQLRRYRVIARFLLARLLYIDGLNTLFVFGGIYAKESLQMTTAEVLMFAIYLNIAAGIGAALFGWVDERIGAKQTILISVAALTAFGAAILLIDDKLWFYLIGCAIGVFIGPTQSASRSMMARLAPPALRTEFFGLFAFSGKVTAFLGPALVALVTQLTESQRLGMATILVFFVAGFLVLWPLADPQAGRQTEPQQG